MQLATKTCGVQCYRKVIDHRLYWNMYTVIIEDPLLFPMIYSVFGGRYIALKFCANISSPAINKIGIPPSPPVLSASADEFESDQFIKSNHHEDLGLPFICR